MTTFDDVRQYIENGTVGYAVTSNPELADNYDWLIECDGVLSGKGQLLFLLEELEATYVQKRHVSMTEEQYNALLDYKSQTVLEVALDDMVNWRDDDVFHNFDGDDFSWAWLYPDKVTIREVNHE